MDEIKKEETENKIDVSLLNDVDYFGFKPKWYEFFWVEILWIDIQCFFIRIYCKITKKY